MSKIIKPNVIIMIWDRSRNSPRREIVSFHFADLRGNWVGPYLDIHKDRWTWDGMEEGIHIDPRYLKQLLGGRLP